MSEFDLQKICEAYGVTVEEVMDDQGYAKARQEARDMEESFRRYVDRLVVEQGVRITDELGSSPEVGPAGA